MASSTTIPIAMESDDRDMMFIEASATNRYINATISDIGIVMMIIIVARHLPRKKSTTRITNNPANISVVVRLLIDP